MPIFTHLCDAQFAAAVSIEIRSNQHCLRNVQINNQLSETSEFASKSHFGEMLDALSCGAALIDRSGNIQFANARLCRMMRRSRFDLNGANLLLLCQTDELRGGIRESLSHFDDVRDEEFFLPLPDGKRLPVIASSRPLPGEPGTPDIELVTMIDVSGQKLAEQRLREQYEVLAEMSNTVLEQALELKQYSAVLEKRVAERTQELYQANLDAITMLAVASEAKDADTGEHVRRMQILTELLALQVGLTEDAAKAIGQSAILHDVGKIHVPDYILEKPGPLTDQQRMRMRTHTIAGEHILSNRHFFEMARQVARSHHENFDGTGYPDGLIGEAIPFEARITRVADVWDALIHKRVYKPAWPAEQAMELIRAGSGAQFDPRIVMALSDLYDDGRLPRN